MRTIESAGLLGVFVAIVVMVLMAAPPISAADPTPKSFLSKAPIRQVMQMHLTDVRYCYERELARDPALAGKIRLEMMLGVDGTLTRVIPHREGLNAHVADCVRNVILSARFPRPFGGVPQAISYPFIFKAE